jgi:hypothetical protein
MQLISARLVSRPWGMITVHCGNANGGRQTLLRHVEPDSFTARRFFLGDERIQ